MTEKYLMSYTVACRASACTAIASEAAGIVGVWPIFQLASLVPPTGNMHTPYSGEYLGDVLHGGITSSIMVQYDLLSMSNYNHIPILKSLPVMAIHFVFSYLSLVVIAVQIGKLTLCYL